MNDSCSPIIDSSCWFSHGSSDEIYDHPLPSRCSCLRHCQLRLVSRTTFEAYHHSCLQLDWILDFVMASLFRLPVLLAFVLLGLPWIAHTCQTNQSSSVCVPEVWVLNSISADELFCPCVLYRKIERVQCVIRCMMLLNWSKLLTWDEWNHVQSVLPIVWDLNRLFGYSIVRNRVTLFVGMFDKTL